MCVGVVWCVCDVSVMCVRVCISVSVCVVCECVCVRAYVRVHVVYLCVSMCTVECCFQESVLSLYHVAPRD